MTERIEHLVLGAGSRGLGAALRIRREQTGPSLCVVDAAARPGGSIRSQRTNGFTCELGPFAFAETEIAPLLALLDRPPRTVAAEVRTGAEFDGTGLHDVAVEPTPVSFGSGCEELAQACRRELGDRLLLGRAAGALRPLEAGFQVDLTGEVPATLRCGRLVLALPLAITATLLAGYDPALADVAGRLTVEPRAHVFLGGLDGDCAALTGYGVVPGAGVESPVAETIYCSNVFARRCLPGRFLLRSELAGEVVAAAAGDDALVAAAVAELRRWTGCRAEFGFTKVHRFGTVRRDATWAECRTRLRALAGSVPGLEIA